MFEKAQHNNKLQQQGEEPSLRLKVLVTVYANVYTYTYIYIHMHIHKQCDDSNDLNSEET